jgi:hypothetical protein
MKKNFPHWQTVPRWQTVIIAVAAVALFAAVASACPTCKEGLDASDPHHRSIAAGFYYSILFMMSMPYLLLGSLGCLAYVSIRRAKAQQETIQQEADAAGNAGGEADAR